MGRAEQLFGDGKMDYEHRCDQLTEALQIAHQQVGKNTAARKSDIPPPCPLQPIGRTACFCEWLWPGGPESELVGRLPRATEAPANPGCNRLVVPRSHMSLRGVPPHVQGENPYSTSFADSLETAHRDRRAELGRSARVMYDANRRAPKTHARTWDVAPSLILPQFSQKS